MLFVFFCRRRGILQAGFITIIRDISGGMILEQSILFIILLQIVLIGLNAVFACAEIAVISVNDSKMEKMAGSGDKRAARLLKLTIHFPDFWEAHLRRKTFPVFLWTGL